MSVVEAMQKDVYVYERVIMTLQTVGYYKAHRLIKTKNNGRYLRIMLQSCVVLQPADVEHLERIVKSTTNGLGKINYNKEMGMVNVTAPSE